MILNRLLMAVFAVSIALVNVAQADQTGNVAVIDVNAVLQASKYAETMKKEHEAFTKKAESLRTKFDALRTEFEKFQKKSTVMTKTEKTKAEKVINEKQNKLRVEELALQKQFMSKRDKLMAEGMASIRTAVSKIAKAKNYSLVVNKGDSLYSSTDITSQVQKAIQ